ncbi:MAG: hypothetical protein JNL74_22105 [Fibrobacteres bacterium]|nr:hypothetical protein [Fibrobacterota bacterium]
MSILKNVTAIVLFTATLAVRAETTDSVYDSSSQFTCQENSIMRELKPTRQYGFIGIGFSVAETKELNNRLDSSGITGFEPAAFKLSFGGHLEVKKLILEGTVSGLMWAENIDNNLRTSLYASNINGNIGVNILPEDIMVTLSPFVGLGLGANWLRICNNEKTLDQAIANSDPNVSIWQATFLTQLGVAVDLVMPSPNKKKGFVIGIRSGYQFAPLTSSWYTEDTPITDVPDIKQGGVFAKLIIGGWKPKPHKTCCCRKGN